MNDPTPSRSLLRDHATIWLVGVVGTGLVLAAGLLGFGTLALVAAVAVSVSATGLATARLTQVMRQELRRGYAVAAPGSPPEADEAHEPDDPAAVSPQDGSTPPAIGPGPAVDAAANVADETAPTTRGPTAGMALGETAEPGRDPTIDDLLAPSDDLSEAAPVEQRGDDEATEAAPTHPVTTAASTNETAGTDEADETDETDEAQASAGAPTPAIPPGMGLDPTAWITLEEPDTGDHDDDPVEEAEEPADDGTPTDDHEPVVEPEADRADALGATAGTASPSEAADAGPITALRPPGDHPPFLAVPIVDADRLDPAWLGMTSRALDPEAPASVATYVPRDLDQVLDQTLASQLLAASGGFVAVQGATTSGLTRTVLESLRRHAARRALVVLAPPSPACPSPFLDLLDAVASGALGALTRPVVLIDDAHRHLHHGLDRDRLVDLSESLAGCTIVVTLNRRRLLLPTLAAEPTEQWLRSQCENLRLEAELSDSELARAFERFPARSLDGRLRWLPAWLSGADEQRARFRELRLANPAQTAVLLAAAAWSIATEAPAIAEEALVRLATAALAGEAASDRSIADGEEQLGPAIEAVLATDLLERRDLDATLWYVPSSVLLDEVAAEADRLPETLWDALLETVDPAQAAQLGRLCAGVGQEERALQALSFALQSDERAGRAAYELGILAERLDRMPSAAEAYRRALGSGDPQFAPLGAFHLGGVLELLGRLPDAEEAYRWAEQSGHADAAPLSAFNLGWLYEQQRDTEAAAAAYERAIASEHPDARPRAACNLGWVRQQQRRNPDAERLYRLALDSGHPDAGPVAGVHLGMLLERLQRHRDARTLYEQLAAGPHSEAARAAKVRLQLLRGTRGGRRR